jgi:hypothetical protein
MGYRSDVAYTIRFVHDDKKVATQSFYTFLAEAKSKYECADALNDVAIEIDEKRQRINFSVESIKWYVSYPEIASHMALLKLAEDWCEDYCSNAFAKPNACAYLFYRVGEEDDDIERHCGGNYDLDWINFTRHLGTDWN